MIIVRQAGPLTLTPTTAAPDTDTPRALDVRLMAWPAEAVVSDDGISAYTEAWEPGGLVMGDAGGVVPVYRGHAPTPRGIDRGALIGRLGDFAAHDDGAYADLALADTADGREVWELARTVGATVSIEADVPDTPAVRGRVVRSARAPAVLTGVAVMLPPHRGAVPGAAVLAARSQPEETTMTLATVSPEPDAPPDPDTPPLVPDPDDPTMRISRSELREVVRGELVRVRLPQLPETRHPLGEYRTFAAFADAAYVQPGSVMNAIVAGVDRPLAAQISRAWVDQLPAENPGVIPPGWVNDVFGIVDFGRPVITAIGTRALPESGMDVNWPYFDGDLLALVGEQAAPKTEIVSVKVSLKRGTTPIRTFAGGSDLSYQLIRRSSPSYRDAYLRIMTASWAAVTDREATEAVYDAATGFQQLTGAATVDEFRAAVFAASVKVNTATGAPASTVLLSTDAFIKYGSALLPANYGTMNQSGTAAASTLEVTVSGLRVAHAPHLPAATGIVTNGRAAAWAEDGPFVISAPDVPKLGEDVAIWGMAALEAFVPAGIVVLAATAPTTATAGRRAAK